MRTKVLSAIIVMIMICSSATAQNYKNALGVKFYPGGITFKHFTSEKVSLEAIGYFYNNGTRITGLYEFNFPLADISGLNWYVGPGVHLGFYNYKVGNNKFTGTALGVDGVIGLDYKIENAPINLSLDWQPSIEFGDNFGNGFNGGWGGLGIRYTF